MQARPEEFKQANCKNASTKESNKVRKQIARNHADEETSMKKAKAKNKQVRKLASEQTSFKHASKYEPRGESNQFARMHTTRNGRKEAIY